MAPEWVYIERVVLVEKNDPVYEPQFPYQAIQVRDHRHCPPLPFVIDSKFKAALRRASEEFGAKRIEKQVDSKPPTSAFLARLRAHL